LTPALRRVNDRQRQQVHCNTLKFKNEIVGMCCALGKVQLLEIETPPEPLDGLLIGTDPDSNLFLKAIRTLNSCFQITSFGATEIIKKRKLKIKNEYFVVLLFL